MPVSVCSKQTGMTVLSSHLQSSQGARKQQTGRAVYAQDIPPAEHSRGRQPANRQHGLCSRQLTCRAGKAPTSSKQAGRCMLNTSHLQSSQGAHKPQTGRMVNAQHIPPAGQSTGPQATMRQDGQCSTHPTCRAVKGPRNRQQAGWSML